MIKIGCDFCGSLVYKYPVEIKRHKHHFCNGKCFGKYTHKYGRGGKKIIICKQCSRQKIVCNASQRNFCSRKCYAKWMTLNLKGKNNPHYGKKWSKKSCINMSKNWHKVIKRVKHLQRINRTKKRFGKHNPNWQDGISFEPYGYEFNDKLKEFIRKRDEYKCQNPECGIPERECFRKLDCHHINYDKYNNDPVNFITLCNSCNIKANYNRKYWQKYYENIQIKRKVHELEKYYVD